MKDESKVNEGVSEEAMIGLKKGEKMVGWAYGFMIVIFLLLAVWIFIKGTPFR